MDKRRSVKQKNQPQGLFISGIIAGGVGILVIFLLGLIIPAMLMGSADPKAYLSLAAVVCFVSGGVAAGVVSATICKGKELYCGGISAAVIVVPLLVASLFIKGFNLLGFVIAFAAILLCDFLGCVSANKIINRNRRNMKKIMRRR